MKTILIPTDFSDNAWNATEYALNLLKSENCNFIFLHTYTPIIYATTYDFNAPASLNQFDSTAETADIVNEAKQKNLKQLIEKVKSKYHNKKHTYQDISAYNILTDEINNFVKEYMVDLVVLGTKGASGAREVLFGSNALHIMRKTTCPVLLIPDNYSFSEVFNILFPTDFKHPYTKNVFDILLEVSAINKAVVHTLHISNDIELSKEQLAIKKEINTCFKVSKHDFRDMGDMDIPIAIAKYAEENSIDLLAMTNRKHSFLEMHLFRQYISTIGMHLTIPLLVLPVK